MTITIENLSRAEALQLLKNVQERATPGFAIQGPAKAKRIATETVTATVRPSENEQGQPDFGHNTFEIQSNYWVESTLRQMFE